MINFNPFRGAVTEYLDWPTPFRHGSSDFPYRLERSLQLCSDIYSPEYKPSYIPLVFHSEPLLGIEWGIYPSRHQHDRKFFLVFRGTETLNLTDWANNSRTKANTQGIHEGWYEAVTASFGKIRAEISKLDLNEEDVLTITGHSRGGAFATIAVDLLIGDAEGMNGFKNSADHDYQLSLITFGSPPVYTKEVYFCNVDVWHIQTKTDIVPKCMGILGYKPQNPEDVVIIGGLNIDLLKAHSLKYYSEHIDELFLDYF
jgi:hypothetical protein